MNAKEIFKIAVRLLGLVFLYHGLMMAPAVAGQFFSAVGDLGVRYMEGVSPYIKNFMSGLLIMGWHLFLAQWLLRGAPFLMRLAYPEPATQPAAAPLAEKAGA